MRQLATKLYGEMIPGNNRVQATGYHYSHIITGNVE